MTQDVYDIEAAVEPAVTKLFEDKFAALSSQDPQVFQKERGRVEVSCRKGAGTGHLAMTELTGLECEVEDAWKLAIEVALITAADMKVHGSYRAFVRYTAARLPVLVNGLLLMSHVIYGPMVSVGDSPLLQAQDGYYLTRLNYTSVVSVHPDTWATLMAGEVP